MNPKENENLWNAACSGDHRLIIKILNVGADVNYVKYLRLYLFYYLFVILKFSSYILGWCSWNNKFI